MVHKRKNRRKRKKMIEQVELTAMAAEGKAMGRKDGKVIFVENAIPGDVVDVLTSKNKPDYAIGRVYKFHEKSPLRIEPFCKHFKMCGGCRWQYITYEQQLTYKQDIVEEAFRRVGKLEFEEILPIRGADETTHYRNKLEYTFSNSRWIFEEEIEAGVEIPHKNALGFHVPKLYHKIVDITECFHQPAPSNEIKNMVRDYALEHGLTFYDLLEHTGFLRTLTLRNSLAGEWMVIVCLAEENKEQREGLLDALLEKFPQITSLHYVINSKLNDTLYDQDIITYHGKGYIDEYLEELKFKISPKSFFQTNPKQALNLYGIIRDFANLTGDEVVYDLYTGTGSIAQFLARYCKKVVGIEEVADAIKDANYNAKENNLTNCHFITGDVKEHLNGDFVAIHGHPDLLVTDPPRAGLHPTVVANILNIYPKRIIYVSCNPVTQARDLGLMSSHYRIEKIQPVDMFPQTYHIENVVLLVKK